MKTQDPETDTAWQGAVDLAHFLSLHDAAKQYGLVTGGPETINVERCEAILRRGAGRGITPRADAIERCLAAYNG